MLDPATSERVAWIGVVDAAPFMAAAQFGNPALISQKLLGSPITINQDFASMAASAKSIAFGDFNAGYTIAERPDLRILRDPFSAKPHVLFYASKRVGGDITDYAAIKLLKVAIS